MVTLGESINNLLLSLPQVFTLILVYKLVFNELIHIAIEPFKPPEQKKEIEDKIIEAVKYHKNIYGKPASPEYVASYIYLEPARKMVDEWVFNKKSEVEKIKGELERLAREGKLVVSDSGYVA